MGDGSVRIRVLKPVQKAFIKNYPKTKSGGIDYGKLGSGDTVWITVKEGSMAGRHIPITKRADGSMALDPFAAESAGYNFNNSLKDWAESHAHMTITTGEEKDVGEKDEKDVEKYRKVSTERQAARKEINILRKEGKKQEAKAEEALVQATGVENYGLTAKHLDDIHKVVLDHAIKSGMEKKNAEIAAKTITKIMDKEDKHRKLQSAKTQRKMNQMTKNSLSPDSEHKEVSPFINTTPKPIEVSEKKIIEKVVEKIKETGKKEAWDVERWSDQATRQEIEQADMMGGKTELSEGDTLPPMEDEFLVENIREAAPVSEMGAKENVISEGDGVDDLVDAADPMLMLGSSVKIELQSPEKMEEVDKAYSDLVRIKARVAAIQHDMPNLPELSMAAPATLAEYRMDAREPTKEEIKEAELSMENGKHAVGYTSFYEALSEQWDSEDNFKNVSNHIQSGASIAITTALGKHLGRDFDIKKLIDNVGATAATAVLSSYLMKKLGPDGFMKLKKGLEADNQKIMRETENKAMTLNKTYRSQLDKINQQVAKKELRDEADTQLMRADILLKMRQNLGQAYGSMNALGDMVQSMDKVHKFMTKEGRKIKYEVDIHCGKFSGMAQERMVNLGMGKRNDKGEVVFKDGVRLLSPGNVANNTGQFVLKTDPIKLASRYARSKEMGGSSSEKLAAMKADTSPVTSNDLPPGFNKQFTDRYGETGDFLLKQGQRNDLNFLREAGGGVITRTTGAGKTLTVLGFAAHKIAENPNYKKFVMVPPGQVSQWVSMAKKYMDYNIVSGGHLGKLQGDDRMAEVRKMAQNMKPRSVVEIPESLSKAERKLFYDSAKGGTIFITSHSDASSDVDVLENHANIEGTGIAIDEPHLLIGKSGGKLSAGGKRIMALESENKIGTTATLTKDKLVEAHDIVNWAGRKPLRDKNGEVRRNARTEAIITDKPAGARAAFERKVGGFGAGTNAHDEATAQHIMKNFDDIVSGDQFKNRDYKVNRSNVDKITRTPDQVARQKEIESPENVAALRKKLEVVERGRNEKRKSKVDYDDKKNKGLLTRRVNKMIKTDIAKQHSDNLYGSGGKTDAFVANIKKQLASGKTHHVLYVGSDKQRQAVTAAIQEHITKSGGYKGIYNVTKGTKKSEIEKRKVKWKNEKGPSIIILDANTSAGHNLQTADSMHQLHPPADASTGKQWEGRGDRPNRKGDLDIFQYKYSDSPHEDAMWNKLHEQEKIGKATAPGLYKAILRIVKIRKGSVK